MLKEDRIPVTILTGFLGAGKTTLLNNIINQNKDKKLAIIENEFGEIGIDNELVVGIEDGIFEMSNGCICCSLNTDLVVLLAKLLDRKDTFNHLIIETTGIADPAGVATAFVADESVQEHFRLDSTICLVDTQHIEDLLQNEKEAALQISFSDVLIFNKTDLVNPSYLNQMKETVQKINPFATVFDSSFAQLDTTTLLNQKSNDVRVVAVKTKKIKPQQHIHSKISSQSFIFNQPLDMMKFRAWMNILLTFQNERIYRIKGVLNFHDIEHRFIFQSVQKQAVFSKGEEWSPEEVRESKIVFIGNELKKEVIEKNLKQCLAKVEGEDTFWFV